MSGGGGTTVNETKVSGLADSQYNNLMGGQSAIRNDIQSVGNQSAQKVNELGSKIDVGFNNVNNSMGNVGYKVDSLSGNVSSGFNNLSGKLDSVGNNVSNKLGDMTNNMTNQFSGLNTNLNNLSNNMKTDMNTGFTNLANQNTQNANAIISGQQKGFGDLTSAVNTGFNENTANINQKFDTQGRAIDSGFANQDALIKAFQSASLQGQNDIRSLVDRVGGNLDTYYGNLSANDTDQTARLGQLQTGLDTFRNDFNKADTLANQQRARIADTVAGGFNAVRDDLGAQTGLMSSQGAATQNQLRQVSSEVRDNSDRIETNFSRVAKELAVGFNDGSRESGIARNDFISRLDMIRSALNDQSIQLDEGLRDSYQRLSTSFDSQGRLISQSVDNSGNQISRALDNQGNLLLATFNSTGQRVDQQALNINQMMKALDQFTLIPGSNMVMGVQPAAVNTSLMSPYTQTR